MKHIIISTVMIMLASQASVGQTLKTYSGLYEVGRQLILILKMRMVNA